MTLDKLGVDIGSLVYQRERTFLTIGDPADGGLAWTFVGHWNSDPYQGMISYVIPPQSPVAETLIDIAGHRTVFIHCESGACQNMSGTGSTLSKTGSNWIYTTEDGSIYKFDATDDFSSATSLDPGVILGKLLTITRPRGAVLTLNYQSGHTLPESVVSSRGYALQYLSNGDGSSRISIVNLANHVCDVTAATCDGDDGSIAISAQLTVVSGVNGRTYYPIQITDATGANWLYGVGPVPVWDPLNNPISRNGVLYYKSPDGYEASVKYDVYGRLTEFADNRGTWTYSYPNESDWDARVLTSHTISVTDPSGAFLYSAGSDTSESWTDYIQDALGNKTQFDADSGTYTDVLGGGYIEWLRLKSITKPELNVRTWSRDSRANITAVTDNAKPNSGLAPVSISAVYPSTCSNPITCNKPTSETDANGNETDYTYDPVHGGVLSAMQPAPTTGAARPLKLTSWVQKTPYYKNASGALVASSTPIWEVSTVTECQTVAGSNSPVCDSAAPKRVTTYEYGADGTANALWPHGIAVAADGTTRRTCYTFDALGDKISETSPRAGLASCP